MLNCIVINGLRNEDLLRRKSEEVKFIKKDDGTIELDAETQEAVQKMKTILQSRAGILALSAPQIGILKRIIAIKRNNRIQVLINPIIVKELGSRVVNEQCESFPNIELKVKRPLWVMVKAQKINGEEVSFNACLGLAQVLSHEIDHLNGELFMDRMIENGIVSDPLCYIGRWEKNKEQEEKS